MRRIVLAIIVVVLSVGCTNKNIQNSSSYSNVKQSTVFPDGDQVAILKTIVKDIKSHKSGNGRIVFERETIVDISNEFAKYMDKSLHQGLIHKMLSLKQPCRYPIINEIKNSVIFANKNDVDKIFEHGFWNDFYRKYPASLGVLGISAPVLDETRQQAVVYVAFSSGGKEGSSSVYLLSKNKNAWIITKKNTFLMS